MSKISKTGLVAALLLFLASNAPNAIAQQDGLSCPLEPQTNRTLALFGITSPLVASDTLAEATTGPIAISLPAAIYNITASSYDAHSARQPVQSQLQEQFYLRLNNGQTTNRISDLPEDSDSFTEQIDTNFTVTSDVTSLIAQHTQYPDPGVPNSIIPVCVAFDDVTPTPTPSPTPTPTPSPTPTPTLQTSQGGPGDETDCCPGPDPEPEPNPAPVPKVAGTQTTTTPPKGGSLEGEVGSVAGAIQNFPSAGFTFKPTAPLIVLLFIALIILPAAKKTPKRLNTPL